MTVSGCTDRHSVETTTDKNYSQIKCLKSCTNIYVPAKGTHKWIPRKKISHS